MPDRLAQLNVLLLCNHTVHYIRLSFLFQSTLPRGERRAYPDRSHMPQNFNPRSHEGSDGHGTASLRRQHNFNPRSHEGSDIIRLAESLGMRISIRAPARGATTVSVCAEFSGSNFNPRSREGSDIDWVSNPLCNAISIRTPARGATRTWTRLPRLCRFQSALPRGERRSLLNICSSVSSISIRAPARGATLAFELLSGTQIISIRAPARGATPETTVRSPVLLDFNPRSREGSDPEKTPVLQYSGNFNPRSREGSDNNFHQKVLFSLSKNCLIHLFFITNFLN